MALAKQLAVIPLARGIDTKSDSKLGSPEAFARVQNAVYDEIGKLKKRNGYDKLVLEDIAGNAISNPKYLTRFTDELVLLTADKLFARSPSVGKFVERGTVRGVFPKSQTVIKNAYEQTQLDSLVSQNVLVTVWNDSRGSVRCSVQDRVTGTFLRSDFLIAASASRPRLALLNGLVYVVYADTTNIRYKTFSLLNPNDLSGATLIKNDLDGTNSSLDIAYSGSRIIIAYNSSAAAKLAVVGLNSDGTLTSTINFAGENANEFVSVGLDSGNRVVIVYGNGSAVKYAIVAFSVAGALRSPTVIESVAGVNATFVSETDGQYKVFYEVGAAATPNHFIKQCTVPLTGSVGSPVVWARSLGLASKGLVRSGVGYVCAVHDSQLQATYFLLDSSANITAKYQVNTAGGVADGEALPTLSAIDESNLHVCANCKGKLVANEDSFFTLLGACSVEFNFDVEERYQSAEAGNNLLIAGGFIQNYDGAQVTEHGFHLFPETITQQATATSGGALTDGTRSYVAIYSWYDNQGLEHRSAESLVLESTLTGGGSSQTCTVRVPTLRLTAKSDVRIDLFRTEDAGTTLYKVTSVTSPTFNNKAVDTVDIVDTVSDTDLISREPLYTTGGILEHTAPPSAEIVATWKKRIALSGTEDPNVIVYSKLRGEGEPIGFNDSLRILCKSDGGAITALAEMDEKLIVFKRTAMFFVAGDGPNNAGDQDNFTEPEQISLEIGCVDRDSVILIPQGLMFKSEKGIYMLTRGLALQYVGDKVEAFNTQTITSAKIIPTNNQVRFTTSDSECLVYNYYLGLWSTFTNHEAMSAEIVGTDYYLLRKDGQLYRSNNSVFADNGSVVKLLVETEWLSFASLQGFQRVYKMLLLGEWRSAHRLNVRFAYDFVDAWTNASLFNPSNYVDPNTYGSQSPYGSGSPYGGNGSLHQARVDLQRQKCQSLKFRIEDAQDVAGEGLSLTAVTFEIGAKAGLNKMGAGRKFGAS